MEEALESLPRNLNETYERMIKSIPTELESDAIRLLQFLVHSKRPLKVAEAKEVIATQIENKSQGFKTKRRLFCETDILDYCPGLIIVHATDKELHLAHFSVKEFLLGENHFRIRTASISIMRTCLIYLAEINSTYREVKRDFPMARYAAEIWTTFAVLAPASEEIVREIVIFLEKEATFQRWARLYQADRSWDNEPGPPKGSRLYYACMSGLVVPTRVLICKGADVNTQGGRYSNALQAASLEGHQEIVKLLLDKGADVDAPSDHYGNALYAALERGYQDIIILLLDTGVDINAHSGRYGNVLYAALEKGCQEIVKLLLDKGVDVNAPGGHYGNALQAASLEGHQQIVKLLLDKGADFNAQGGRYGNALQIASQRGHQEIVKILQRRGAEISFSKQSPSKTSSPVEKYRPIDSESFSKIQ
jgi:ankyrin repeat protein